MLQLEGHCADYQAEVGRLQREVFRLSERLESRDKAIKELNEELVQAKEEVAKM